MKTSSISVLFLFFALTMAQGQCLSDQVPYAPKEKLSYTGYYHWGLIWISAGEVEMKVTASNYAKNPTYRIIGTGKSAKSYDVIFKLRDTLITHLDKKTLLPLYLDRRTHEGKYNARHIYKTDTKNNQIDSYIQKRKRPAQTSVLDYQGCFNNILSVLYFARSINYDDYEAGAIIPIQLLVDGKMSEVEIRYHGIEDVKIRGKQAYKCYKITPVLPEGSMFKGGDDMIIWLTHDANRVPLLVDGKIPVGSVKAILKDYSGLKNEDNILGSKSGTFQENTEN